MDVLQRISRARQMAAAALGILDAIEAELVRDQHQLDRWADEQEADQERRADVLAAWGEVADPLTAA